MNDHHLLVVDDDDDIREALSSIIRQEGYSVDEARHGRAALDFLRKATPKPCVILLDLMMPVMSGWDLVGELSRDEDLRTIPIVLVTADARGATSDPRTQALPVVGKPLDLARLMSLVEQFCGRETAAN
jgi:CheY-like chemotaxis protein